MLRIGKTVTRYFSSASLAPKDFGNIDDYEILSSLGKGSSARVFLGTNLLTKKRVVIKMFKHLPVTSIQKEVAANLKLLSGLSPKVKHAQFIHLLDTLYDYPSSTFTLVFDYFPGVPLRELISVVSVQDALKNVLILAHTLKYIHSQGLVHRDIKPGNVLITPNGPKLFDFGLTNQIDNNEGLKINNFGTKCYKTPEVVFRMPKYHQSADIWGLGIILAETVLNKKHLLQYQSDHAMLSQISSFCGFKEADGNLVNKELLRQIRVESSKSWLSLAKKKQVNPDIIDITSKMLQINPKNRPSLDEIINHPAFKDVRLQ